MLLTGPEILAQVQAGRIVIDPLPTKAQTNPNSINLTVGPLLRVYEAQLNFLRRVSDQKLSVWDVWQHSLRGELSRDEVLEPYGVNKTVDVPIPPDGLDLVPGIFYLGYTVEVAGSKTLYAPMLEGRSTWARLSLQSHAAAGWGDVGWNDGQWTLEITVTTPVTVRPSDELCQIAFARTEGQEQPYKGRYRGQRGPVAAIPLPGRV